MGIIIIAYDPGFTNDLLGLFFVVFMAFLYATSNMLSRYLNDINTIDQIGWHSLIGFFVLLILSIIFEDNPISQLHPLNYYGLITLFMGVFSYHYWVMEDYSICISFTLLEYYSLSILCFLFLEFF